MKTATLILVGAGALLLLSKAKASAAATQAATQQNYYTPTAIASALGSFVVGLTKGIATSSPTQNVSPNLPAASGDLIADSGAWIRKLDSQSGSLLGWTAPQVSSVSVPSLTGTTSVVDAMPAAPVYSTGDDFSLNPALFAAAP